MTDVNELRDHAKNILRSYDTVLGLLVNDFILGESDFDKDDWYVTSQQAARYVMDRFKAHLRYLSLPTDTFAKAHHLLDPQTGLDDVIQCFIDAHPNLEVAEEVLEEFKKFLKVTAE